MSDHSDIETAKSFLSFMIDYYALVRRHIIETNQFRLNSHGFSMLYTLRKYKKNPITMTKFADEMGITKQQLTKLVNDLENKKYVRRSHNKENRRQVYIEITDEGDAYLDNMIDKMIDEVVTSLRGFSEEEKKEITFCAEKLSEVFKKDEKNFRLKGSEE